MLLAIASLLPPVNVINKKLTGLNEAVKYFKIPRNRFEKRVKNNDFHKVCLSHENQRKIVFRIKKLQMHNCTPLWDLFNPRLSVNVTIKHQAIILVGRVKDRLFFLIRNSDLSVRHSESIRENRVLAINEEVFTGHFELLKIFRLKMIS